MDNIVSVLIKQHRDLQGEVNFVLDLIDNNFDSPKIVASLTEFKKDLDSHVELEKSFYEELLRKMENAGQDTKNTRIFMGEMIGIGKIIYDFLDRYNVAKYVEDNKESFSFEMKKIKETLWLRIESEEEGVYVSYNVLK